MRAGLEGGCDAPGPARARYIRRRAPIAQLAEAADLKSVQCRFEPDWGHAGERAGDADAGGIVRGTRGAAEHGFSGGQGEGNQGSTPAVAGGGNYTVEAVDDGLIGASAEAGRRVCRNGHGVAREQLVTVEERITPASGTRPRPKIVSEKESPRRKRQAIRCGNEPRSTLPPKQCCLLAERGSDKLFIVAG